MSLIQMIRKKTLSKQFLYVSTSTLFLISGISGATAGETGHRPSVQQQSNKIEIYMGESYGFQAADVKTTQNANTQSATLPGFSGGLLAGINWHIYDSPFVTGLEVNAQIGETRGETSKTPLQGTKDDLLWDGALRARIGYKTGTIIPFVSGGLAIAEHHKHAYPEYFGKGMVRTLMGWTLGAGIEAPMPNLTKSRLMEDMKLRLEYAYAAFEPKAFHIDSTSLDTELNVHNLRLALIKSKTTTKTENSQSISDTFNGIYGGATFGIQNASATTTQNILSKNAKANATAAVLGLFYGIHVPVKSAVIGFEGDFTASLGDETTYATNGAFPDQTIRDLWSARARLIAGYPLGKMMPYISAGMEYGQFEQRLKAGVWTSVEARHGLSLGTGLNYKLSNAIFMRAEALYGIFPEKSLSILSTPYETKQNVQTFRVGLGRYF